MLYATASLRINYVFLMPWWEPCLAFYKRFGPLQLQKTIISRILLNTSTVPPAGCGSLLFFAVCSGTFPLQSINMVAVHAIYLSHVMFPQQHRDVVTDLPSKTGIRNSFLLVACTVKIKEMKMWTGYRLGPLTGLGYQIIMQLCNFCQILSPIDLLLGSPPFCWG